MDWILRNLICIGVSCRFAKTQKKPKELHENTGFNLQNRHNSSPSSGLPWAADREVDRRRRRRLGRLGTTAKRGIRREGGGDPVAGLTHGGRQPKRRNRRRTSLIPAGRRRRRLRREVALLAGRGGGARAARRGAASPFMGRRRGRARLPRRWRRRLGLWPVPDGPWAGRRLGRGGGKRVGSGLWLGPNR
jgi:hypothetical protein